MSSSTTLLLKQKAERSCGAVPGSPITGVELNGVRLHMLAPDPVIGEGVGGNLDLRWTALTPRDGIVKSDIPAFYAKRVDGLRLSNVQVDWANSMPAYFSDGIRIELFHDLTIDSFAGRQAQSATGAAIDLRDGSGCRLPIRAPRPARAPFYRWTK